MVVANILSFPVKDVQMSKILSYEDDFEMVILRHDYIRKIPNPDKIDIGPYKGLAAITARILYEKCQATFNKVGYDSSDIENIANTYLLAYLGLYSFEVNEANKERFIRFFTDKNGRAPVENDFKNVERNLIINFIRQKLHHCSTVCERKSRNIVGAKSKKITYAFTVNSVPCNYVDIAENYAKFGYRKVEIIELKQAKFRNSADLKDKDGFKIVEVFEYAGNIIGFDDLSVKVERDREAIVDYIQPSYMAGYYTQENAELLTDPQNDLLRKEQELMDMESEDNFNNMKSSEKKKLLKKFIEKNTSHKYLSQELRTARLLLKNM